MLLPELAFSDRVQTAKVAKARERANKAVLLPATEEGGAEETQTIIVGAKATPTTMVAVVEVVGERLTPTTMMETIIETQTIIVKPKATPTTMVAVVVVKPKATPTTMVAVVVVAERLVQPENETTMQIRITTVDLNYLLRDWLPTMGQRGASPGISHLRTSRSFQACSVIVSVGLLPLGKVPVFVLFTSTRE